MPHCINTLLTLYFYIGLHNWSLKCSKGAKKGRKEIDSSIFVYKILFFYDGEAPSLTNTRIHTHISTSVHDNNVRRNVLLCVPITHGTAFFYIFFYTTFEVVCSCNVWVG